MTSALSIRNLRKTYDNGFEALKGIDLEVPRGAFFGLLGPNGAGKSTLINIIAGLTIKSAGEVTVCGHNIDTDTRAARCAVGVVPQELIIDTFFTVRQALDIHAGYYGVPPELRRTQEIIDALGLSDKADINSRKLSGGMRRRLLVGKALVHNPPVLILDEPTAGVDVELRTQLWDYVRTLNEQGTTVILTTHYLEEAEELCDQIAIIHHGALIAHDSTQALLGSIDEKCLEITMEEPLETLPESIRAMNGELISAATISLSYRRSEVAVHQILKHITEAGLTIRDVATKEADLEDVFRLLTSEKAAA